MKGLTETRQVPSFRDFVAEPKDRVEVELLPTAGGLTLYVHANGQTLLRIGKIAPNTLAVKLPQTARPNGIDVQYVPTYYAPLDESEAGT